MTRNHNFRMNYTRFIDGTDSTIVSLNISKYIEAINNTGVLGPDIKLRHDSTTINYYGLLFIVDMTFNKCMTNNNKLGNPYSVAEVEEMIIENSVRYLNTNGSEYGGLIKSYEDIPSTRSIALIYEGNNMCQERLEKFAMEVANQIYENHKYEPLTSQSLTNLTKAVDSKLKSLGYDTDIKVDTFSNSIDMNININQAMEDMNKRIYSQTGIPSELLGSSMPGVLGYDYDDLPVESNEDDDDGYETIPRHRS